MKALNPSNNWQSNLRHVRSEAKVETGMSLEEYIKYDAIKAVLETFKIVQWDRWSGTSDSFVIFGWIDRKEDSYKDFVTINFYEGRPTDFATSSAKYSESIAQLLGFTHSDCNRVEDRFDIENVIRLKEQ